MVYQLATLVIIPIILTLVTVSPFEDPIEEEIESIPQEDNPQILFIILTIIWFLFLLRVLYQVKKGTFSMQLSSEISHTELEQAQKALADIRLANNQLQSTFGGIVNSQITKSFSDIEKALSSISLVLEKSSSQSTISTIEKSLETISSMAQTPHHPSAFHSITDKPAKLTMKRYSLLQILKMSMPRKISGNIKINLPERDIEIYGHMYKLTVLFSSLLENSIQALDKAGEININAMTLGHKIRIEIEDSGKGIPEEVLDKLFTTMTSTKKHGTGLGTKMAKSIVDLHGGNISARNNPTTFTIDLPFQ
jgi:signal transduction histidine kinase